MHEEGKLVMSGGGRGKIRWAVHEACTTMDSLHGLSEVAITNFDEVVAKDKRSSVDFA